MFRGTGSYSIKNPKGRRRWSPLINRKARTAPGFLPGTGTGKDSASHPYLPWAYGLIGLLLGHAILFDSISPIGLAYFAAAASLGNSHPVVFMTTLAGLAATWEPFTILRYAATMALLWALLALVRRRSHVSKPFVVVSAITACGFAFVYWFKLPSAGILTIGIEAALAGLVTFPFIRLLSEWSDTKRTGTLDMRALGGWARAGIYALLFGAVVSLSRIRLYGVSPGEVIGGSLAAALGFTLGPGVGAVSGTCLGLGAILSGHSSIAYIGAWALGGLISGIFRPYGRPGSALGFIAASLLFSFQVSDGGVVTRFVLSAFASGIIFWALPLKFLVMFSRFVPEGAVRSGEELDHSQKLADVVSRRLTDFSKVFEEVAAALRNMPGAQACQEKAEVVTLLETISTGLCRRCSRYLDCWVNNFHRTYRDILNVLALSEVKDEISIRDVSGTIDRWCIQPSGLIGIVNMIHRMRGSHTRFRKLLLEARGMVASQLQGVSGIIEALSAEILENVEFERETEAMLRRELRRLGLDVRGVSVMAETGGRLEVSIAKRACNGREECRKAIVPLVSRMLGRRFTLWNARCGLTSGEPTCVLNLSPARNFAVETACYKMARERGSVSGDSHSVIDLPDGRFVLVLSDGMGVGARAAQESRMAVSMLEKLIRAGFDHTFACKTVNSILLLRSPGETFATVDLVVLDLCTGEAEFVKVGSSPSFIKRGNEVGIVKLGSLPAGILTYIDVESTRRLLREGDILVMVSDGVLDAHIPGQGREEWVKRVLETYGSDDLHYIARRLLEDAGRNAAGRLTDDATVLVARLIRADQGAGLGPANSEKKMSYRAIPRTRGVVRLGFPG